MEMAHESGLCPILMMSGETTSAKLAASKRRPPVIFENIGALAAALRKL
jgi:ribonucleotide monophosphatase NagD (HAD superfamily)